jgi:ribonucleoside-diphosphate reductase beta chain
VRSEIGPQTRACSRRRYHRNEPGPLVEENAGDMRDGVVAGERADLEGLGHIPIDDVMTTMDEDVPGYRELYYLWERQQWEAGAIDLSGDRRQWVEELSPELQYSLEWIVGSFLVGEEHVTKNVVPFVDASPSEEQAVFLTTQLADVARHTVFIDRFQSEVVEGRDEAMLTRSARRSDRPSAGLRPLVIEMLPEAAGRIRQEKGSVAPLVEGVVLYHLVIEACVMLTGRRFLLGFLRDRGLLPGLRRGLTAVARDESRHVNFAVRFLRDMVELDPNCQHVIRGTVARALPVALTTFQPPGGDTSLFEPFPFSPDDLTASARESLGRRLTAIGAELAA